MSHEHTTPGVTEPPPAFSVVIPTRNRPELLARAIRSVRMQEGVSFELIVVDDGTLPPHANALAAMRAQFCANESMVSLPARDLGHGPSFAMNEGVNRARYPYICFLDDDDEWIDTHYLARAADIITASAGRPDVIYFQQRAQRHDGTVVQTPVWLEGLQGVLASNPLAGGGYLVDAHFLLRTNNHCHFNSTIILQEFFDRIGGLNEGLRYENDRDFYLRSIDAADRIFYAPFVVSLHNVPDKAVQNNMSTLYSQREKWLYQASLFNRNALTARHPAIRRLCRKQFGYTMKKIALSLAEEKRFRDAFRFARLGYAWGSGAAWAGMTAYLGARALLE
jgi:glycosyltransferase involved in cell wall biosynthesis